jgi:uncharacterized protein (TIGR01244 family)
MLKLFRSDAERYAARERKAAYWSEPIDSPWRRLAAWANLLLVDHGVIRLIYLNAHRVTPQLLRAAQPAPHDIRRFAREGVKTIVTLRGGREQGGWPLEVEACAAAGIALKELTLRSREPPDRDTLLALPAFFASLQYPALAHCKSGADRAGLFSALYLLVHEGRPVAEAKKQLSLRYGHVRMAKTGMLDAFLDAYAREGEAKGVPFMEWVRDAYDPARVAASFHEGFWASLLIDRLMRRE